MNRADTPNMGGAPMRPKGRSRLTVVAAAVLGAALLLPAGAAVAADYGPANAAAAMDDLPNWRCRIGVGCPLSDEAYAALSAALAGDREAQFKLAELLRRGDGIPRDEKAATGWYGKAAEQGHVAAALELNHLRHQGADITADETKIVAALGPVADKGDTEAMRALADMEVYGRGTPRNAERGLALLRRAVAAGSALAAQDLANLLLGGAPGIPRDPAAGFSAMTQSARLGNEAAMLSLGSMYLDFPDRGMRNPAEGYRWLTRAAQTGDPAAQELLSGVLADGVMAGATTVIPPDAVAADMWLRLAARSPYHDNQSLRRQVEADMTTAQLDEAKKRAATWQAMSLKEALALNVALPKIAGAKRPWPPGLHGRALDRFQEAGDNPPPWLRLPDFARNDDVADAITAIATQCDHSGNGRCAATCRQMFDYVAPPVKLGGLSPEELADYFRQHPDASSVRAMRKAAATPEEAMSSWVMCANGIDSDL